MRSLSLLALPLVLVACQAPPSNTVQSSETAAAEDTMPHQAVALTATQQAGETTFNMVCWSCHANDGRGDGPAVEAGVVSSPPDFQTGGYATLTQAELEQRFQASLQGGNDPKHPHMKYVASLLKPEKFGEALAYIPALAYPPEIPGSAINGQRIFQFRCAPCHGKAGRGNGPAAASLVTIAPANFTTDTLIAKKDWQGVYNRIKEGGQSVHGSAMPTWGVILKDSDIWDLVAYLATFQPGLLSKPIWEK
jgi:mono/diheme cytochrome c family protein